MEVGKALDRSPNWKSMPTQRLSAVFLENGYQLTDSCQNVANYD